MRTFNYIPEPKLARNMSTETCTFVPVEKDFKIPLLKNFIVDNNFFFLDLMRGFDFLKTG